MNWKRSNGYIVDEHGNMVCVIPESTDENVVKTLLATPEILNSVAEFVRGVENNTFKARKCYNKLKQILDEINFDYTGEEGVELERS